LSSVRGRTTEGRQGLQRRSKVQVQQVQQCSTAPPPPSSHVGLATNIDSKSQRMPLCCRAICGLAFKANFYSPHITIIPRNNKHMQRDRTAGFFRTGRPPLKANSHIPYRSPAVPCRAVPCRSVPLRIQIVSSHLIHTCYAAPVPCHDHAVLKATSQGHDTTRHGRGIGMEWHM
jgi:hypothetical protein